jgi:hypothetical protein
VMTPCSRKSQSLSDIGRALTGPGNSDTAVMDVGGQCLQQRRRLNHELLLLDPHLEASEV